MKDNAVFSMVFFFLVIIINQYLLLFGKQTCKKAVSFFIFI